jgi:hypothetical protein
MRERRLTRKSWATVWKRGCATAENISIRIDIDARRHRAVGSSNWLDAFVSIQFSRMSLAWRAQTMQTEDEEAGDHEEQTDFLAAGKNELELPMAKPLINRMRPTQIRVRETGSGSFGSIGGEDGPATMWLSRSVTCVVSQARIPSNYNSTKVCFAYFAFCTGGSLGKTKAWILPYGRLRSSTSRNCSTRCELRSAVCRSFTLAPRQEPVNSLTNP